MIEGWSGRLSPTPERWHEVVQLWSEGAPPGIGLVGFASDEGVRRNQGRVGAAAGPNALRATLSNLTLVNAPIYDAADVRVVNQDLESAQSEYADRIAQVIRGGSFAVGLGGGHEIAWGTYQGLARSGIQKPGHTIGILNIDAHLDLRKGAPSSGTPFMQAIQHGGDSVSYLAYGVSEAANGESLFATATEYGVTWISDDEPLSDAANIITSWLPSVDHLFLSLDLDSLPASVAPGVSAPAARGVSLEAVEELIAFCMSTGKVRVMDVAELNPTYDIDQRTARTAARLIWRACRAWAQQR